MKLPASLQKFASSAVYVLVARILACAAVISFNFLLARALSPSEFGTFVLAFSWAGLASLAASLGLNRALVKIIAESGPNWNSAHTQRIIDFGLIVGSIAGVLVGALAAVCGYFCLPNQSATDLFMLSVIFGGIVWLRTLHLVLAESARGFHEKLWSNLYGSPAGGPVPHLLFALMLAIGMRIGDVTLGTALIMYLSAFALTLPPLMGFVRRLPSRMSEQSNEISATPQIRYSAILALSMPLMLTQVCGLAMSQADIWLAGALVTPSELAMYGSAARMMAFLTMPLQIAGTTIVSFLPDLIARNDRKSLQEIVGLASTIAGLPGIFLIGFFLAMPEAILGTIFGDFYREAANILRFLTVGQGICILTGPCEIVLLMAGYQKYVLRVNAIAAAVLVAIVPLAIDHMGVLGLGLSMCVVTSLQNFANWCLAGHLVGIKTHFGAIPLDWDSLRNLRTLAAR